MVHALCQLLIVGRNERGGLLRTHQLDKLVEPFTFDNKTNQLTVAILNKNLNYKIRYSGTFMYLEYQDALEQRSLEFESL